MTLYDLQPNQSATIIRLNLQGIEKNRIMDLGFIKGSIVTKSTSSLFNDPTAYLIKGSTIALRKETTTNIIIEPI